MSAVAVFISSCAVCRALSFSPPFATASSSLRFAAPACFAASAAATCAFAASSSIFLRSASAASPCRITGASTLRFASRAFWRLSFSSFAASSRRVASWCAASAAAPVLRMFSSAASRCFFASSSWAIVAFSITSFGSGWSGSGRFGKGSYFTATAPGCGVAEEDAAGLTAGGVVFSGGRALTFAAIKGVPGKLPIPGPGGFTSDAVLPGVPAEAPANVSGTKLAAGGSAVGEGSLPIREPGFVCFGGGVALILGDSSGGIVCTFAATFGGVIGSGSGKVSCPFRSGTLPSSDLPGAAPFDGLPMPSIRMTALSASLMV